jgi:hypothetical protein
LGGDKVSFVATARTGAYNVDVATRHTTHEISERGNTQEVERDFAGPEKNDGHGLEGVLVGLRYGLFLRILDRFTWR